MISVQPSASAGKVLVAPPSPLSSHLVGGVGKVKNCFQIFQESRSRQDRSNYFSSLDDLAMSAGLPKVSCFRKDVYIRTAERILGGEIFKGVFTLYFPAARYTGALGSLERELRMPQADPEAVVLQLRSVRAAHAQFIKDLEPEFQRATRKLPETVAFNFPLTLALFEEAFQREFGAKKAQAKEIDPSLVLLLPRLALCHLIQGWSRATPELLKGNEERLSALQEGFRGLSSSDQEALLRKLKGEAEELSDELKPLYLEISSFGFEIHRAEPEVFNNIMAHLFQKWNG